MRILGIDPGLAIVGYGIIDVYGNKITPVDFGSINTPAGMPTHKRLNEIFMALNELICKFQPDDVAVEELFWNTAKRTPFAKELAEKRKAYTEKQRAADLEGAKKLLLSAKRIAEGSVFMADAICRNKNG